MAGRDFHGGLVGLHGDQGLLGLDGVAGLDQQFNDGNFVKIANIGNLNIYYCCHVESFLKRRED